MPGLIVNDLLVHAIPKNKIVFVIFNPIVKTFSAMTFLLMSLRPNGFLDSQIVITTNSHSVWLHSVLPSFNYLFNSQIKKVLLFLIQYRLGYVRNPRSLMEGTETLCCDDIGDLPGSPEHLWLRENANEIG